MTIDAKLFAQAGEALFGLEWKRPLGTLLGMNERTVFRIAKAAWATIGQSPAGSRKTSGSSGGRS